MKTLNKENSLLKNLEEIELEEINGGGWMDKLRWGADFGRGLVSFPYGCGMGDAYIKGSTYTSSGGGYLKGSYGRR
ncbi:hypothetical protein [Bacillus cereus]|uniref:hypothetical protein n=1 Tax=Bacillus cereus TaxID=1396 RepID=UPI0006A856D0|nr:hypothetical protein [Bacillus cereus]CUB45601.1 hypothetical protein BN2127_JRS4_04811 [Bacillus cereus]